MNALAIAFGLWGALGFLAFVLWMRSLKAGPEPLGPFVLGLRETTQRHEAQILELVDKVNGLSLAAGLRAKPKG